MYKGDRIEMTAIIVLFIAIAAACIGGCSTMTPDEREALHARNVINWERCKVEYASVYKKTRTNHGHRRGFPHKAYEIRDDLLVNNCRRVLGKYWVDL